jgi:hypothetical protein
MTEACRDCGRNDGTHEWVEGTCVLPHRNHSRKLVDGAHVCTHCVERHETWLTEIVELYATLADVVLTGSVETAPEEYQKPRKRPASPSPLRLGAWAMLHGQLNDHVDNGDGTVTSAYLGANLPDVPAVLAGWAQALYDTEGWGTAPRYVSGAAAVLKGNSARMAGNPDVDTYDTELKWVRRALRSVHGVTDPKPLFKCITVDCTGQVWAQETGQPKCGKCQRRYGRLDYVRAARMHDIEGQATA